jgi:AcrR family transcriptional regulator
MGRQREWGRSVRTRTEILNAAAEVFAESGYGAAAIAVVAEHAGVSTGSLYHHFGGKAQLFLAVWESHQDAYEEQAASGVREAGRADPVTLLLAGTRAYLQAVWRSRDLEAAYRGPDVPAELGPAQRLRTQRWISRNLALLNAADTRASAVRVAILTVAIGEAAGLVVACDDEDEAIAVIDEALGALGRIVAD